MKPERREPLSSLFFSPPSERARLFLSSGVLKKYPDIFTRRREKGRRGQKLLQWEEEEEEEEETMASLSLSFSFGKRAYGEGGEEKEKST